MDVDDMHADLSEADAVTQHIYSTQKIVGNGDMDPLSRWACHSWREVGSSCPAEGSSRKKDIAFGRIIVCIASGCYVSPFFHWLALG